MVTEHSADTKEARRIEVFNCEDWYKMEIDGVSVRVGRGADARTVAAVIRALQAGT
jgi:hypothetical protein